MRLKLHVLGAQNDAELNLFEQQTREINAEVATNWIEATRLDLVAAQGTLHTPGPSIKRLADLLLRTGLDSSSITGITHTVSSAAAVGNIADPASAPTGCLGAAHQ